ncbi:MAG: hypothetical protein WBL63_05090 [Candidatus Acidiferrum sp.]
MGYTIRKRFVKKRLISSPRLAIRAICSALIDFRFLYVFFIEGSFFLGCLPQRNQMEILSFLVFAKLKNYRVQRSFNPSNRAETQSHALDQRAASGSFSRRNEIEDRYNPYTTF